MAGQVAVMPVRHGRWLGDRSSPPGGKSRNLRRTHIFTSDGSTWQNRSQRGSLGRAEIVNRSPDLGNRVNLVGGGVEAGMSGGILRCGSAFSSQFPDGYQLPLCLLSAHCEDIAVKDCLGESQDGRENLFAANPPIQLEP